MNPKFISPWKPGVDCCMSSGLPRGRHQNGTGCANVLGKRTGAGRGSWRTTVQVWPPWEERQKEGGLGRRRFQLSRVLKRFSQVTVESSSHSCPREKMCLLQEKACLWIPAIQSLTGSSQWKVCRHTGGSRGEQLGSSVSYPPHKRSPELHILVIAVLFYFIPERQSKESGANEGLACKPGIACNTVSCS